MASFVLNQKPAGMTKFFLETNNCFDFKITCLQMTMIKQTGVKFAY